MKRIRSLKVFIITVFYYSVIFSPTAEASINYTINGTPKDWYILNMGSDSPHEINVEFSDGNRISIRWTDIEGMFSPIFRKRMGVKQIEQPPDAHYGGKENLVEINVTVGGNYQIQGGKLNFLFESITVKVPSYNISKELEYSGKCILGDIRSNSTETIICEVEDGPLTQLRFEPNGTGSIFDSSSGKTTLFGVLPKSQQK